MSALPRSWLFTPGSRPDRFDKAAATEAGALILDLEDAVADHEKAEARGHVVAYLDRQATPQNLTVRINPLSCATGMEDLVAFARLERGPDMLLMPKSEEPAELTLAARVLEDAGSNAQLVALVETARGIALAHEIATATPRLAALMFGAADYAANLGQQVGVFQADFARASLVNAAAVGGIAAIDSPFFAIDRTDDLAAESRRSRGFGFFAKAAIHPSQIGPINAAFAPTAAEQDLAHRILGAAPSGVGVLDGKMIDVAMIRWARGIAAPA